MLLVITPSAKARGSVQAIQQITSEETHVAATSSECVVVLIDQAFMETETDESDMMLEYIGQPLRSM